MNLTLTPPEAQLLRAQLARHLEHVQSELAHTENPELQHSLANDVTRLGALVDKIDAQLRAAPLQAAR
jgi:hypothetical protein